MLMAKTVNDPPVKIAFVTYETPFAPCGGIAAVMGRLPGHIQQASGMETVVISPFHHKIEKTVSLQSGMALMGQIKVPIDGAEVGVDIYQYRDQWSWYFLKPSDTLFFAGQRHPYDVPSSELLRDSLFFGASVARAMEVIDKQSSWKLMLQDWEAATTALALVSQSKGPRIYLTLHNSYDIGATGDDLGRVRIDPSLCPGSTVLQRTLPLIEWPVFTVSNQFALDLIEDDFQAKIMAPHLNALLKPRLVGVNNGLFAGLAIDKDILTAMNRGNFEPVRNWKRIKKAEALQALDDLVPSQSKPVWGNLKKFKRDNAPWFVTAGRDDPRQKGYDVATCAISKFLDQGGEARFLFFPIPGDEGLQGLNFLKKLAEKYPEHVLALPFLFKEGFFAALYGASYGIMPSLYEPFGMANEFYLNGTVGIARATGGLLQQIVPLQTVSSFDRVVQKKAARWHTPSAQPTGILFLERDDIVSAVDDWQGINAARYDATGRSPDRVEERMSYALFGAMAEALCSALLDGVQLYLSNPQQYYQLLTEGINYMEQAFSWEKAAQDYVNQIHLIRK